MRLRDVDDRDGAGGRSSKTFQRADLNPFNGRALRILDRWRLYNESMVIRRMTLGNHRWKAAAMALIRASYRSTGVSSGISLAPAYSAIACASGPDIGSHRLSADSNREEACRFRDAERLAQERYQSQNDPQPAGAQNGEVPDTLALERTPPVTAGPRRFQSPTGRRPGAGFPPRKSLEAAGGCRLLGGAGSSSFLLRILQRCATAGSWSHDTVLSSSGAGVSRSAGAAGSFPGRLASEVQARNAITSMTGLRSTFWVYIVYITAGCRRLSSISALWCRAKRLPQAPCSTRRKSSVFWGDDLLR